MSIQYVRATEQLADMFTKGAFTKIQWASLVQLLDIHPPHRDSSESFCSAVSPMSDAHNAQRDFDKGSWKTEAGRLLSRS